MFRLEDDYGIPWTASAGLGWVTVCTVITFGIAAPILGLYLSVWIRRKGASAAPVFLYSLILFGLLGGMPLSHAVSDVSLLPHIGIAAGLLWIMAAFALRREIQRYYRHKEGWEIQIRPVLTLLFGTLYMNYCLNPLTLRERNAATTLNLRK